MSYPGQILFLLLSCFILLPPCPALPDVIPIGGVFHPESNDHQDVAFQYAVERINMDIYLLPHSRLERHIANVSFVDSFTTGKRVCDLMEVGVTAVFGPESDRSKGIVRSICDTLEIPNLQTNWRGSLKLDAPCQLNMHPDPDAIALALVDVLKFLSWKSFAIVYESNEGLMRLQEVFKSRDKLSAKISVYQLSMDGDHRSLFKDIHDSTQTHILLDCATDNIMNILRQAKEVDMFGDYENYFITSLDAHTLDFSEFEHLQTNVTFLRLIDPNSPEVVNAVNDWVHGEREYGRVLNIRPETVRVEAALMYDAVNLFAKAITQLDNNNLIEVTPLNCESGNIWPYGFALKNYMKHIKFKGMTGEISFDARGWRNHFTLDVVEVLYGGITKIGVWDSIDGINSTKTYEEKLIEIEKSIQNKTFIIFSKIGMPYLGWKDKNAEGNDRFEGFSMDLISEIMTMMNAKGFEFRLASDNNHGSLNKETGKWNGIMKEIIDRKGDLGICDLTITYDRRQAVDFTMPFMNLGMTINSKQFRSEGISILFTKPVKEDPELFSFLKPFSFDVWIFLATAYLTISLILFFLARITPYEWDNPNPNDPDPDELETSFNILNCLWFSIGTLMASGMRYITEVRRTLMAQGCDILPRAVSTRMLACIWWFFLLILNSSYTANLAAFLTTSRIEESINNAEDLASQTRVKVGALRGGATESFFSVGRYKEGYIYRRCTRIFSEIEWETILERNLSTPDRDLNLVFPSIGSLVYCENSALDHTATEVGYGYTRPARTVPHHTELSTSGNNCRAECEGRIEMMHTHGTPASRVVEVMEEQCSTCSSSISDEEFLLT
uniref:Uncharacterized protein n=1 Tax=Timema genevievae TaxID=629358 RepID=A0A7R9PNS7_TIMGE|nr:unnamed protein product [Timema genevievae]